MYICNFYFQQDAFMPSLFRSVVEVDAPTTKIYRFHGAIVHPTGERVPVGTENLLLRECVLKNTDFVEGIVVYAGKWFCLLKARIYFVVSLNLVLYKNNSEQNLILCEFFFFFLSKVPTLKLFIFYKEFIILNPM